SIEHLDTAARAINDAGGRNPTVREGALEQAASIGEAFAVAADVRKPEEVEKAIASTLDRFGKIDIVVNGAAGNFLCTAEELSPNGFGTVVDIDLKGTFNVCRAAFAELKKNRGQILNISATLHYLGTPMQLHVSAAKAGVDALTKNPAVEWGHRHSSKCNRARADRRYRRNEALSAGTNQGEIEETHSPRPFRIDQRHRNSG